MIDWPESVILQINQRAKSISLRLVFFTTLVFGVISATGLAYFFQKRLEDTVSNTIGTLQQSILLGDVYQLKKLADSLVSGGSVSGVWISEGSGELLTEKIKETFEGSLQKPSHDGIFFTKGHILASHSSPIVDRNGKHFGEIVVVDPFPIGQFFSSLLFLAAILGFAAVYLIESFKKFGSYISQPLLEFCEQLSSANHYNKVVSLNKPFREIALLEAEFNNLLFRAMNSEQKQRDAEKQAAIGRIIAHITHDMRAPLGIFENLLAMPQNTLLSSQSHVISTSVRRLYAMIESLRRADLELFISRTPVVMDANSVAESLHNIATSRNIDLKILCPLAPVRMHVDYLKLERAWINLVSNALDFAKASVTVEFICEQMDLIIRVTDDGQGVPDEFLPRLFERGATHGKTDGTGLGLAYVRQIMRGHGGDVTYRRENGFTIFECRLADAVEPERNQDLENKAEFNLQMQHNLVRTIAICLEPEQLSTAVLAKMSSLNLKNIFFTNDRSAADSVVSNIDDVMFEVLDRTEQEVISVTVFKGDETKIIDLLKKKFCSP